MGIDLRLVSAMVVIAYAAYVFIGQALSPVASSRRRVRRLQLWYARSIAVVLILCSLVTAWVPTTSLKEGVVLTLTTAILPLAAVSLVYSALVLKRLYARWRSPGSSRGADRSEVAAPMSLAELHAREERIRQEGAQAQSQPLAGELDELDEQLVDDLNDDRERRPDARGGHGVASDTDPNQARQQRA